jgi:hypothetical protein
MEEKKQRLRSSMVVLASSFQMFSQQLTERNAILFFMDSNFLGHICVCFVGLRLEAKRGCWRDKVFLTGMYLLLI